MTFKELIKTIHKHEFNFNIDYQLENVKISKIIGSLQIFFMVNYEKIPYNVISATRLQPKEGDIKINILEIDDIEIYTQKKHNLELLEFTDLEFENLKDALYDNLTFNL